MVTATVYDNKEVFYRQISAIVHTSTIVQGNALNAIENKAAVTLTSFKTAFRTSKWVNKAGTGPTTGVGTHLVVTAWRAGSSYKRRRHLYKHLKYKTSKQLKFCFV